MVLTANNFTLGRASVTQDTSRVNTSTVDGDGGMITFEKAIYEVNQTNTTVKVYIARLGGNSGAVTVNYELQDGSISSGASGYAAQSGSVVFADGEWGYIGITFKINNFTLAGPQHFVCAITSSSINPTPTNYRAAQPQKCRIHINDNSTSSASAIWVNSETGSDSNTGVGTSNKRATIQKAITDFAAGTGDIILVEERATKLTDTLNLTVSGAHSSGATAITLSTFNNTDMLGYMDSATLTINGNSYTLNDFSSTQIFIDSPGLTEALSGAEAVVITKSYDYREDSRIAGTEASGATVSGFIGTEARMMKIFAAPGDTPIIDSDFNADTTGTGNPIISMYITDAEYVWIHGLKGRNTNFPGFYTKNQTTENIVFTKVESCYSMDTDNCAPFRLDTVGFGVMHDCYAHHSYDDSTSSNTLDNKPFALQACVHGYSNYDTVLEFCYLKHAGKGSFEKDPANGFIFSAGNYRDSRVVRNCFIEDIVDNAVTYQVAGDGPTINPLTYCNVVVNGGSFFDECDDPSTQSSGWWVFNNTSLLDDSTKSTTTGRMIIFGMANTRCFNNIQQVTSGSSYKHVEHNRQVYDADYEYIDYNTYYSSQGSNWQVERSGGESVSVSSLASWQTIATDNSGLQSEPDRPFVDTSDNWFNPDANSNANNPNLNAVTRKPASDIPGRYGVQGWAIDSDIICGSPSFGQITQSI